MSRLLVTVSHSTTLAGRDTVVLFPGFHPQGDERFRAGDPIELRRPDGQTVQTHIGAIEVASGSNGPEPVIVLPRGLSQDQVPIGTEVWSLVQPEQPPALDYAKPQSRPRSGGGRVIAGFLGGWFLGVIVTGILADIIAQATLGHHHDGGMYFIAAYAIAIEAPILAILRSMMGLRINGLVAFLFGFGCGPLILTVMFIISAIAG